MLIDIRNLYMYLLYTNLYMYLFLEPRKYFQTIQNPTLVIIVLLKLIFKHFYARHIPVNA